MFAEWFPIMFKGMCCFWNIKNQLLTQQHSITPPKTQIFDCTVVKISELAQQTPAWSMRKKCCNTNILHDCAIYILILEEYDVRADQKKSCHDHMNVVQIY